MGKMTGRVAIVTGASRGIGQAIAELFAHEGAKVVCVARTLNEGDHQLKGALASTVAAIKAAGGEATAVAADISSEPECLRLVGAARAALVQSQPAARRDRTGRWKDRRPGRARLRDQRRRAAVTRDLQPGPPPRPRLA